MLIAPAAGSESAKAPDDGAFDVALVVVHGMGNAFTSQVLLEWAEPLLSRLDWLARDPLIGGGDDRHGVKVHESTLVGATPTITATVSFPRRRGPQGGRRIVPVGTPVETAQHPPFQPAQHALGRERRRAAQRGGGRLRHGRRAGTPRGA